MRAETMLQDHAGPALVNVSDRPPLHPCGEGRTQPYSSSFLKSAHAAYFFAFLSFAISRFRSVRSSLCCHVSRVSSIPPDRVTGFETRE
jgi:hypothetical protein